MLNGFTYSYKEQSKRYYCSKLTRSKCKSSVKLDADGKIVQLREEHNHEPPKYSIMLKDVRNSPQHVKRDPISYVDFRGEHWKGNVLQLDVKVLVYKHWLKIKEPLWLLR